MADELVNLIQIIFINVCTEHAIHKIPLPFQFSMQKTAASGIGLLTFEVGKHVQTLLWYIIPLIELVFLRWSMCNCVKDLCRRGMPSPMFLTLWFPTLIELAQLSNEVTGEHGILSNNICLLYFQ